MSDTNFDTQIARYERGELSFDETIQLFQELIESGFVWQMQEKYSKVASELIQEGYCWEPEEAV